MKMIFFKDGKTGEVYSYSENQVEEGHVKSGLTKMSAADVEKHLSPSALTREQVETIRLIEYANPLTGSDRYKAEAYAERISGNEEAAIIAEQKMLERREQIKLENPWPQG